MEVYRNKYVAISIHAPASGATIRMEDEMSVMENFNPRSREWSDHSTHPEGYRLSQISIHAPASGATSLSVSFGTLKFNFNPRSREWSDSAAPPVF